MGSARRAVDLDAGALRVGILVVAYEAADTIEAVLDRIPVRIAGFEPVVLIADDASTDATADIARRWAADRADATVVVRPANLGYGGNQKAGYRELIGERVDVIALLHGDAQYRPELLGDLIEPIVRGEADAVLGSRMAEKGAARRGGMPLIRRVGNRVLSTAQNRLTGSSFTEWHSGMRAYRASALTRLDLTSMPDAFDFDTALMLALLDDGARWSEISIPTRYAEERSRVQLFRFGLQVLRRTVVHRWPRLGR